MTLLHTETKRKVRVKEPHCLKTFPEVYKTLILFLYIALSCKGGCSCTELQGRLRRAGFALNVVLYTHLNTSGPWLGAGVQLS